MYVHIHTYTYIYIYIYSIYVYVYTLTKTSNKAWKGASKQQVPEKCLKWENFAHNRGEFVKQLGGSHEKEFSLAGTRTLDKQWDWLKYT